MIFKPHSLKQQTVLFSEKRIVIAATGIQWGKTRSAALWMKMMMHTYTNADDNFIITAPTYPIFKQSTLPPFLALMDGLGRYDKKEECFIMHRGGTCWFRTGKNPDSVVGITNVRGIVCDEAGLYSLYFWENIQGRSSIKQAPIRIVTSPYSLNWLYRDFIKPKRRNPESLPDIELIQATSKENPHFPAEEYDLKKLTMDPRRFNMMYGGEFDKMQGLVYDCFDEDLNSANPFKFPAGTQFFGGIDWGYTEPFVLVIHAVLPDGDRYQVSETYRSGLTLIEIGQICQEKMKLWGVLRFYAGPDQPGSIEHLNRLGCPTIAANNDIRVGIDIFYELIKSRKYKIIKGTSPHTIDEFDTYHYPEPKDIKPDQNSKEAKPVGQTDHACLAANTEVITPVGSKLICDVVDGDYVLTPLGFRLVLAAGKTGERETLRLTTPDGRSIEATPDHPFYMPGRGFVPLDTIRYPDIMPAWKTTSSISFLIIRSIFGTVVTTCRLVAALKAVKGFMWQYGKHITAQCRKAFTFIIRTAIAGITTYLTSNLWKGSNTLDTTGQQLLNWLLRRGGQTSIRSGILRRNGTEAMKGANGIDSTLSKPSESHEHRELSCAKTVKESLKLQRVEANFARKLVSHLLDVSQELTTLQCRALSVGSFLVKTNTKKSSPVPGNVVLNTPLKQDVYNLTVEGVGCFFANGFLVSNCDANRYVIVMTHRSNMKHVPKSPRLSKNRLTEEQKIKNLMKTKP